MQTPKTRKRDGPVHRWTKEETVCLLEAIIETVRDTPATFEKPTSRRFYERVFELCYEYPEIPALGWNIVKNKIRNLRQTYSMAKEWEEQKSPEFIKQGKGEMIRYHMLKLCPHFNLLEQIFNGRWKSINSNTNEIFIDSSITEDFVEIEKIQKPLKKKNTQKQSSSKVVSSPKEPKIEIKRSKKSFLYLFASIQEKMVTLDEKKLEQKMHIGEERLQIEKEKLQFEREKNQNELELKRYEIDRQAEIKKLQMEQQERLELKKLEIEMERDERLRRYELHLKYKIENLKTQ